MQGMILLFLVTPAQFTASCSPRGYTRNVFDQQTAHLGLGLDQMPGRTNGDHPSACFSERHTEVIES